MNVKVYGRCSVRAVEVFQDVAVAERWLKSPTRLLGGRSPLEALETAEGADKVEQQLRWFAGRLHAKRAPSRPGQGPDDLQR